MKITTILFLQNQLSHSPTVVYRNYFLQWETSNYLFRALLQSNNHVLKGLISSLSYLYRTYDNLNAGDNYQSVKPAIQIGLLDFTLFPEYPEFFSTYQLMNVKNYTIYSDKMRLCVLNLTRIDLATKEDKARGLDKWAALFKAGTWEELKMLAQKDEIINEATSTIYQLSQEEKIRLQCEAREDYYRRQRSVQAMLDDQASTIAQLTDVLAQKNAEIAEKDTENALLRAENKALKQTQNQTPLN